MRAVCSGVAIAKWGVFIVRDCKSRHPGAPPVLNYEMAPAGHIFSHTRQAAHLLSSITAFPSLVVVMAPFGHTSMQLLQPVQSSAFTLGRFFFGGLKLGASAVVPPGFSPLTNGTPQVGQSVLRHGLP